MREKELQILVDFYKDAERLGPGSSEATLKALSLTGIQADQELRIADIGCGTGAQTITLAENTKGSITAIDLFPEFLEKLDERAGKLNLADRIITRKESMDALPFDENEFDLIWSEGAIYLMGFEEGIKQWRRFLKPQGILAVSEISWITDTRPKEIEEFWKQEYPQIDTISAKTEQLTENGYEPIAHFVLPEKCWIENYYLPIERSIPGFLAKFDKDAEVEKFIEAVKTEISLYNQYKDYYSYGFYIARKIESTPPEQE